MGILDKVKDFVIETHPLKILLDAVENETSQTKQIEKQWSRIDKTVGIHKTPGQNATAVMMLMLDAGFPADPKVLAKGARVVQCESSFNSKAAGDSGNSRGLWQIHKPSHPNVANECAFDPVCSTKEALRIWQGRSNSFDAWTCGRNDRGNKFLEQAKSVAAEYPGSAAVTDNVPDEGIFTVAKDAVRLMARLFEPEFWGRVGKVVFGFLFILVSLIIMVSVGVLRVSPTARNLVSRKASGLPYEG